MKDPVIIKSERVIHLTLTDVQRKNFVELCDVASRGAGIMAARAAMPLVTKVRDPRISGKIEVEFNETECSQIANLFQAAIQVRGLEAAEVAIPIIDLISDLLQSAIIPANKLTLLPSSPEK